MPKKNKKLALNSGIQTYQILTNDDEVCIPSLSSILLAIQTLFQKLFHPIVLPFHARVASLLLTSLPFLVIAKIEASATRPTPFLP